MIFHLKKKTTIFIMYMGPGLSGIMKCIIVFHGPHYSNRKLEVAFK